MATMVSFLQVVMTAPWPLNVTIPAVAPKVLPEIVIDAPGSPLLGLRLEMTGVTVNVGFSVVPTPPGTVTTTGPVLAVEGTVATTCVAVQLVMLVDCTPLNFTVAWVVPKFVPVIVTEVLIGPEPGDIPLIDGAGVTVNVGPVAPTPPTAVIATLPVVVPDATVATICDVVQLVIFVAWVPLKVTVPWEDPKFVPVIVTELPTGPVTGEIPLIAGAGVTVNVGPVAPTPPGSVTTTAPVVALEGTTATIWFVAQLLMLAWTPLNLTVPCGTPKFVPVIVTELPTAPEFGEIPLIVGAGFTVNVTPALVWPPTVTVTGPVTAPVGTGAVMLVELQAVGVEVLPLLKVTVLPPWSERKFVPAITMEELIGPPFGVRVFMVGVPVANGTVIWESFVLSISSSPLYDVVDFLEVLTPTHR
jgi:hypothetical protein